jgi:hypothetical protein
MLVLRQLGLSVQGLREEAGDTIGKASAQLAVASWRKAWFAAGRALSDRIDVGAFKSISMERSGTGQRA